MTELEHIEIEGFKGLEHVEFEPTDINLITGRNNTGKTSFLQAIDMVFNPENIDRFEGNIDTVINIDSEIGSLKGETSRDEMETILRNPSNEELIDCFTRVTVRSLMNSTSFLYLIQIDDSKDEESAAAEFEEVVTESLLTTMKDVDLNKVKDDFLVVTINGENYPYFSPGERSSEIISEVYEQVENEFGDRIDRKVDSEQEGQVDLANFADSVEDRIGVLSSLIERISGKTIEGFIEEPNNTDDLIYIESVDLTEKISRESKEGDGLKVDNIGDYIKESNLVDDLKTFTLDYLVFERENGDKYEIPYEFMGDGFRSIVGLLWELVDEDTENEIVLIEEPETHMHPGYIREVVYFLIQLAREEDVQLFITTHDSDFINDFFTENLTEEEESYLKDEFSLLRIEDDSAVVEDYETARENLKDLHLDLRGI